MMGHMAEDINLIGNFCSELYDETSYFDFFKVYEKYIEKLGYDGACYTFFPKIQVENIPLVQPIFKFTKNYPDEFLEQYGEEQLHNHDFTIRKGKENCSLDPMDWREHELSGTLKDDEIGLIKLAKNKYGIINAFTIPTQVSDVILAGATIVSSLSDNDFQKLKKETLRTLDIITKLFHDKCYAGSHLVPIFSKPLLEKLNPTELKTLKLLSEGIPTKQLSNQLEVTEQTAKNIISNLCKKLGKINRDQLFFLVGRLNLLSIN